MADIEGEFVSSWVVEQCSVESFQSVVCNLQERYPDGWESYKKKRLKLVKRSATGDSASWYVEAIPKPPEGGRVDWKRIGWARIEACKKPDERIGIEVWDNVRARKQFSSVGHVSLEQFVAEVIIPEATGSISFEMGEESDISSNDLSKQGEIEQRRERVRELRKNQWSIRAIANAVGYSEATVKRDLHELGKEVS